MKKINRKCRIGRGIFHSKNLSEVWGWLCAKLKKESYIMLSFWEYTYVKWRFLPNYITQAFQGPSFLLGFNKNGQVGVPIALWHKVIFRTAYGIIQWVHWNGAHLDWIRGRGPQGQDRGWCGASALSSQRPKGREGGTWTDRCRRPLTEQPVQATPHWPPYVFNLL